MASFRDSAVFSSSWAVRLVCLFIAAQCTLLFGQFNASIQGTVTDPSGGFVADAPVILVNTGTSIRTTVSTDKKGSYRFNSLGPGLYQLSFEAPGFSRQTRELRVNNEQAASLNVQLAVSGTNESVTVSEAAAPVFNPDESRLQLTLDARVINDLPIENRNVYSVVTTAPGVTGFVNAGASDNFANENRVNASANGHYYAGNLYVLDGININSTITGGTTNVAPNPDSVQEVALQTNTFSVERGEASSIQIELTTKSGANKFHGSGNYLFFNDHLEARSYFVAKYSPFRRHDVNGALGGPIVKNKTFFFSSVEDKRRTVQASTALQTSETPEFRNFAVGAFPRSIGTGLLTAYPAQLSNTKVIRTAQDAFGSTCGTAASYFIPCSLPVIQQGNNIYTPYDNGLQYNFRVDQYFHNSQDRLFGNYYRTENDRQSVQNRPGFNSADYSANRFLSTNYTHTFSANLLNQVQFGFYEVAGFGSKLGAFNIPVLQVTGTTSDYGVANGPGPFAQRSFVWRDALNWNVNRHSFRFGGEFRREDDKAAFKQRYERPIFGFNNLLDFISDVPFSESNIAYDPVSGSLAPNQFGGKTNKSSLFAQDDWKVTPNLLLTMGIRWDDFGNVTPFGFSTYNRISNIVLGSGTDFNVASRTSRAKVGNSVFNGDRANNFSPRIGVAWSPTSRLLVRGGVGIFRDDIKLGQVVDRVNANPPGFIRPVFTTQTAVKPILSLGTSATAPFGFVYPQLIAPGLDANGGIVGANAAVNALDPDLKAPKSANYVLGVEYRVAPNSVLGVNYSGSYSFDQLIGPDVNRFPGDLTDGVLNRLSSSFGSIGHLYNGGLSRYDAMIATFRQTRGSWLNYQVSYTWSHTRDYGIQGTRTDFGGDNFPEARNPSLYYADASFDVRQRFTASGSVTVPQLSAGAFSRLVNGWQLTSLAVGQTGTPFSVFTTLPFSRGGDYNADGYNYDFPNAPLKNYGGSHDNSSYISGLFQASEFSRPNGIQEGSSGRNQYRNPGLLNIDVSLIKNNRLNLLGREGINLQIRADFYNIFNKVNLLGVSGDLSSAVFGRSTDTYQPRIVQLGARFEF